MNQDAITTLLKGALYQIDSESRRAHLLTLLREVTAHHMANCAPYSKFCASRRVTPASIASLEDVPYLPTGLFKDILLLSISQEQVFRELRSSATSSGRPSRIGLDRDNNRRWTLSMQRMLLDRIGDQRLRMMVLDEPSVVGRGTVVSARASMTQSLMFAASGVDTCLNVEGDFLRLDRPALEAFLAELAAEPPGDGSGAMLFGFTFILYIHVVKPLLDAGICFDLPGLKIVHAGGWKKLESLRVSRERLVEDCARCFGTRPQNVVDIYGFTEQGGMLYPTCEHGLRHTPAWSEVVCRDPLTLKPQPFGEPGLMQYLTPIQLSYPGHSVITEDMGVVHGRDDCPCGRKGTSFSVIGRSQAATEERGCGDIMASMFA